MLRFVCIGAQRAGTSWLFSCLRRHPEIWIPPTKELHFWKFCAVEGAGRDFIWHLRQYESIFAERGKICGEISPDYAIMDDARVSMFAKHYPNTKILYIIRNPVDMAYSQAKLYFSIFEKKAFENIPEGDVITYLDGNDVGIRSDFIGTIKRWRSAFGINQVLILNFDELSGSPLSFLFRCVKFIGAQDREYFHTLNPDYLRMRQNVINDVPMSDTVRNHLVNKFHKKIKELSEFMGQNFDHWLEK